MQRSVLFLVVVLAALALVSAKTFENLERTLQASTVSVRGKEGEDDSDDMKIVACCIMNYRQCEDGYCDAAKKDQKTLYDALVKEKVDYTTPTDKIDPAELAKMHGEADLIQLQQKTKTMLLEIASQAGAGAGAAQSVKAKEGVHLPYVDPFPSALIEYKEQAADGGAGCPKKISHPIRFLFASAIKQFHQGTCLRWKENAAAALHIGGATGGSYANALGNTASKLCINTVSGNGHLQLNTLLHEMGHIAGFAHTHKRTDVATFLTFNDADIKKYAQAACGKPLAEDYPAAGSVGYGANCMVGWRYQFKKENPWDAAVADVAGSKYDYKSIMHYPFSANFGGIYGNCDMMTPDATKYGQAKTANNNADIQPGTYGLTAEDLNAINKLYGCIQVTVKGKRSGTPLSADKKIWVSKTHTHAMIKHIVEEATGLSEATVVLKKNDDTAFLGTLDAAGVAHGDTIKAEIP